MNLIPCRDCGGMISSSSRGCPKCARNLEAERMIERILSIVIALAILLFGVTFLIGLLAYRNR